MFGLFKRKQNAPPFNELEGSSIKGKYFVRTCPWGWHDDKMIHVFDLNSPRVITMDPWPQLIFLEADGQKTIEEFVHQTASTYGRGEKIPEKLDSTILEVIASLLENKLIELQNDKTEMAENVKKPRTQTND